MGKTVGGQLLQRRLAKPRTSPNQVALRADSVLLAYCESSAKLVRDPKLRDRNTQRFAEGERVPRFEGFRYQADKRLEVRESPASLRDLAWLPNNRLEALSGDRRGQYSIPINQQRRPALGARHESEKRRERGHPARCEAVKKPASLERFFSPLHLRARSCPKGLFAQKA